jgi:DNA-binding response OmpR family regulator
MERSSDGERPTVLVVEDEPELLEIYGEWLAESYDVKRAGNGRTAIQLMDDSVVVALLDRKMPDMSGDQVLEHIREVGYNSKVAMVTAVEPGIDVAEMGFDDYVRKPVTYDDLHGVVGRLLQRRSYDDRIQEYFAIVSKLVTLETADVDHSDAERYRALVDRKRQLREEIDEATDALEGVYLEAAMTDFDQLDVWAE